jgi:hypothetical protein
VKQKEEEMAEVTNLMILEEVLETRVVLLTPHDRDFLENPHRACINKRKLEQEVLPMLRAVQAARRAEKET